jgi:hypothetical protein
MFFPRLHPGPSQDRQEVHENRPLSLQSGILIGLTASLRTQSPPQMDVRTTLQARDAGKGDCPGDFDNAKSGSDGFAPGFACAQRASNRSARHFADSEPVL